jgi:hypothetical protein
MSPSGDMTIEEARQFVHNRLSAVSEGEWFHQGNEETYQQLLNLMEPYMPLNLACSVLSAAFWAAANEHGN